MTQQHTSPINPFQHQMVLPTADATIDPFKLARRVLAGRYQILAFTLMFIALAGAYAFTAKEVWTSKAVLDKPRLEELGSYYHITQHLKRILGNQQVSAAMELKPDQIAEDVYTELLKQAASPDQLRAFWEKNEYLVKELAGKDSELAKSKMLADLVENNIKLTPANEKKNIYPSLSLSADKPQVAKLLLEQYLSSLNAQIWARKNGELQSQISQLTTDLQEEKNRIRITVLAEQQNMLDETSEAMIIANKARIENVSNLAMQGNAGAMNRNSMFLLGTKILDAKITNLTTKPPIFPVRYFEIEYQLKELASLTKPGQDMRSFRFLESPSTPLTKDQPKRMLILFLGAMLGAMVGVIYVLGVGALREEFAKKEASK